MLESFWNTSLGVLFSHWNERQGDGIKFKINENTLKFKIFPA